MESQPLVLLSGAQGYVTSNRPYERSNFLFRPFRQAIAAMQEEFGCDANMIRSVATMQVLPS